MGFGDLLGPGLEGYLISDSLARMNDFPSLSAMGAAYLHGSFIWWFCFLPLHPRVFGMLYNHQLKLLN